MKSSDEELERRFAEADRRVLIPRRATIATQPVRGQAPALRSKRPPADDREVEALAGETPDRNVRARWAAIRARASSTF